MPHRESQPPAPLLALVNNTPVDIVCKHHSTTPGESMTWTPMLEEFTAYQRAKGLSRRTIENRDYMIRALARDSQQPAETITIQHLRKQLGRGVSRGTMQTERGCYRAFFTFMFEEKFRTDDPSERLPLIRAPRGRPRPYSAEQVDRLLNTGSYRRTRIMILLAYYQGFRASEVAAIHGHDIDLDESTIRVQGKGGKVVILPLHPTIADAAQQMPKDDWWFAARGARGGHIHPRSVYDLMTRAKQRAGIVEPKLTGHSLRHAYGTDLVRSGVDLRTVQELMRHESLATTQIYTLISDEQMRNGILHLTPRELAPRSGRLAA